MCPTLVKGAAYNAVVNLLEQQHMHRIHSAGLHKPRELTACKSGLLLLGCFEGAVQALSSAAALQDPSSFGRGPLADKGAASENLEGETPRELAGVALQRQPKIST